MSDWGVFSTRDLERRGWSRRAIAAAVRSGRLRPVIRGWFATPVANAQVVRAFELGGRAGCLTALGALGAWVPPDTGLHIAMPSYASGRRLASGVHADVTIHWHGSTASTGSRFAVSPPETAVHQLVACQPLHFSVAVLDSLLHHRLMSRNRLTAILAGGSATARELTVVMDGRSESGIESIARCRLRWAGIPAEPQVVVSGIGRVDLLIDGWLVVELDGREFHAQEAAFASDRRRTNLLHRDGRVVLQFDYAAVVYDWPHVEATIRSVLAQHAPVRLS